MKQMRFYDGGGSIDIDLIGHNGQYSPHAQFNTLAGRVDDAYLPLQ
ncbi:MAG: hypothetical protein ABL949_01585 [Fimbriimonadaceae bacterium]